MFAVKDPKVTVIYISPFKIDQNIINYYIKLCEIGEVSDVKSRIHFLNPVIINLINFRKIYQNFHFIILYQN